MRTKEPRTHNWWIFVFCVCLNSLISTDYFASLQISWIRRRDFHVISSGVNVYSNDKRFSVLHDTNSHDWTLQLRHVTDTDKGMYECQVSTDTGIISLFVNLRVIVPEAKIIGQTQYHINKGSSISLTCVVHNVSLLYQQSPPLVENF